MAMVEKRKATTPPPIQGPTSKEKKYDRQLRLWAASGQQALEDSHVLLINSDIALDGSDGLPGAGVVGVETLKNLVLPGVGRFTIVDPAAVSESDLGVNFFLEESSLGKSRAEECCKLLNELNSDVRGSAIAESIETLLQRADFLSDYSLILITSPCRSSTLRDVCAYANAAKIPVIYVQSIGFYSVFTLQLPSEFPIVDTHPDPASTQDLRLSQPWPELANATAAVKNLEQLDNHEHGHVPYILVLLHFLDIWKDSHEGKTPSTYKEKTEFRELVRSGARTNTPEGGEENFDEAIAAVLKSIAPPELKSSVKEMFSMESCTQLRADSANFWIIAASIKGFYEKHGVLPLPGSLPDMKAQSSDYINLQDIYKTKARKDVAEVLSIVRSLETQLGREVYIPEAEVEAFCKSAAHVKVIHGHQLPQLNIADPKTIAALSRAYGDWESLLPIFLVSVAFDAIANTTSPSSIGDAGAYAPYISELLRTMAVSDDEGALDRLAQEFARAAGGELHNISALTGGMVAQEVIKVLTKQYVPVDNVCIYDGIKARTAVYKI